MSMVQLLEALTADMTVEAKNAAINTYISENVADLGQLHADAVTAAGALIDADPTSMSEADADRAENLALILAAVASRIDTDSQEENIEQQAEDAADDSQLDAEASEAINAAADAEAGRIARAEAGLAALKEVAVQRPQAPAKETEPEPVAAANLPVKVPLGSDVVMDTAVPVSRDADRVVHSLYAAGDIPGYHNGTKLDSVRQLVSAIETGMGQVARSQARGVRKSLASIKREAPEHLTYTNENDWNKITEICDEQRLPGGSLVAAGGWCSPSQVLYDVCPIPVSNDGMVDLPTITAARGGIKYSKRPDFSTFWGQVGFEQSEADAIAGVPKPCWEIPCPSDLAECRMSIEGICLKQPILTEQGWPEKVEEFLKYAMAAHAHFINAKRIRQMVDLATWQVTVDAPPAPDPATAITDPHGPGAVESLLSILELQVEYFRYSMRLARRTTLQAIAPYWLRGILRADISKKLGIDNRWGLATDQALDRWFRDRGVHITYVYDWQDAMADQDPNGFGAMPPEMWPSQVSILLWEAGAYFAIQRDVINLTGVYDSVDLQKNVYTKLFTEEGFNVCMRCGRSMLLTVNLCPNGLSGGQQLTRCDTPAPPAP